MCKNPYFSIIVAAFNAADTIKETIESVLCQSFRDFEIIVKDALSSDNTLEQIPEDDRIWVISSKDGGIYDGMNQGIQVARGNYLCFLNCGDFFYDAEVLETMHRTALQYGENYRRILFGDYFTKGAVNRLPRQVSRKFLLRRPLCHQTMFFGRALFEELGLYDCGYRILADYDFTMKAHRAGAEFCHSGIVVCSYLGDGVSVQQQEKNHREWLQLQKKYFSASEQLAYRLQGALTLRPLRVWMASDRSPAWMRNGYHKIANKLNQ